MKAQIERLQERRRELLAKLAAQEQEAAKALLEGREAPPPDDRLKSEIERLDRAIELGQEQLAALELDRIYEDLAALRREEERLTAELQQARKPLEEAEKAFREAEAAFGEVHNRISRRLDELARKRMSLEAEAQKLTAVVDPVMIEDAVPKFLESFRKGEITTFIQGLDPAQDKAFELYQAEVREIQAWARKDALSRTTTGERIAPPECVAHYTKERLQEIINKAQAKGGVGTMEKPETGLLLEQRKVSI